MTRSSRATESGLPHDLSFEATIAAIEKRIEEAASDEDRAAAQAELERESRRVFSKLTPWQHVELARHAQRPRMLDYTSRLLDDFVELHGDRALGDDPALVGGIGRFRGRSLVVVGQQKGVSTDEKVKRNFGMPHPEGYRKALRLFELAERLGLPVVTLVDTPAAHPGLDAEQHGQGPAIARNLWALTRLHTPVFTAILGEGGSGGALGIAVGDWVAMFEHAIYVICPPERCAEILWRDPAKKELAASALRVTAAELLELGVIDAVLPEPGGGAHRNPDAAADVLAEELDRFLAGVDEGRWTLEARQQKFRRMGRWEDAG
ncbi:MAG: acetyl-CoA carboxylase carboxyltransferase subunit alpha [Candidatus Hydrogenedentes bacterium]|nr:acetyl-CoA carboxylase carboxyltransferase subunit alpha [Candidatus Hydrogenedentota bacterium]